MIVKELRGIKTITVKCHLISWNINNGEDLYNPFWNSNVNPFLEIIFVPFIFQQSQLSSNQIELTFFSLSYKISFRFRTFHFP
jgi:hypothetical protein